MKMKMPAVLDYSSYKARTVAVLLLIVTATLLPSKTYAFSRGSVSTRSNRSGSAKTAITLLVHPYTSHRGGVAMESQEETREKEDNNNNKPIVQTKIAPAYTREVDPNTNNFPVQEATVQALIKARNVARTKQDFQKADAILTELVSDHGVLINDSHHTWKTATKKELKKLPKKSAATSIKAKGVVAVRYRLDYEPYPHAGPHASALSENEIQDKISERREAQKRRDFDEADRIRSELKSASVYLDDARKEWRADGVPFRFGNSAVHPARRGQQSSSSSSRSPIRLVQSEASLDVASEADQTRIESLLTRRSQFKSSGNYDEADEIRDRLFETYNIRIDDRLGEWSVGGNFAIDDGDDGTSHWASRAQLRNPQLAAYIQSPTSEEPNSPEDKVYIQQKVDERMRAKRTRNYNLSDAIRDELLTYYDVTIHDKINQWSVGGDFGSEHSWKHVGAVRYVPHKNSNDDDDENRSDVLLSPEEIAKIDTMIDQRGQARRDRDLKKADQIARYLSKTFAVVIDDQTREWYCETKTKREEVDVSSATKLEKVEAEGGRDRIVSPTAAAGKVSKAATAVAVNPCSISPSRSELSNLTVVELKERLRNSGMKVSGKKQELIERLLVA